MRYSQIVEASKKRATPEGFHDLAKMKFGSRVGSLTREEILSVAAEHGLQVPGYIAGQKVGRGLYSVVPPSHKNTKILLDVANEIHNDLMNYPHDRWMDVREPELEEDFHSNNTVATFGLRHWGIWEMPPGEEDDGDYDWEILSRESSKILDSRIQVAKAKYPHLKIQASTSEKNWIDVTVSH
jgi:hypothetical protein